MHVPKSSSRGTRWAGIVGLAISAALLWWALHDIELRDVVERLRGIRLLPYALTIVLATAMFPLRTLRWRVLLRAEGGGGDLPLTQLWHATAIGFMASNLLPTRAGELVRPWAARELTGVPFTTAFASIAVERVLDGLTLVAMLVVATWAGGFAADTTIGTFPMIGVVTIGGLVRGAGVVFTVALVAALGLVHWPAPTVRLVAAVSSRILPSRVSHRVVEMFNGLIAGLDALRNPGRFVRVLLWSVVVWSFNWLSFWMCFAAFGLDLPWSASLMLASLIAFGVAIPSAPGFFGPFEAATRLALALYLVPASDAISYAIGYHLGTFLPITLLGLWSLGRANLGFRDLRTATTDDQVDA